MGPDYEQKEDIKIMIRCLPALAHVPVDDVEEAFLELAEAMKIFLSNHPTMWFFFDGIKKDIGLQTASFLQGVAGGQRQPKKAFVKLQGRVQRAVTNYGRADRLTYLRAIAHLSHT